MKRLDVVFDLYKKGSLKAVTHKKRRKGTRRIAEEHLQTPAN